MNAVAGGDEAAFGRLCNLVVPRVYGLSVRVLQDRALVRGGHRPSALQQVRDCLECLTDLQRQAVTLAYYDGHTYREVADLLNVALPTVKTRMWTA